MEYIRCTWPGEDPLMIQYHDEEWGVPLFDDNKLFEFIVLDAFQAGLNWRTILHKREAFRKAFAGFDYKKIARFDEAKINSLMQDKGIIRNQLKIKAAITNARLLPAVQKEFGSFANYVWQFTNGQTINNNCQSPHDIPSTSKESDAMSADMRKRGFKFVGSTICYAFMQAAGMVNDHLSSCYCYKKVST